MTEQTDSELLKNAAKAAGISGEYRTEELYEPTGGEKVTAIFLDDNQGWWNPLTDDGDALWLACKLRINIEHAETLSRKAHGVNCWPVGRGDCGYIENDLTDYNAATRRAITRAAAAIGEAMQ